jgi:hypothetical protein
MPPPQLQTLVYDTQQLHLPIFQPFTPGTLISTSPYPAPTGYPLPIHHPTAPASAAATYPQSNNMAIIPAPTQAGFIPHPPATIPRILGVHQYPLFVSKEGEGPPPLPVFLTGYPGAYGWFAVQG